MIQTFPTLASNVPPPARCQTFELLCDAYCGKSPNLRNAKPILHGNPTEIPAILNHNARMIELIAKYGSCDMYAVAHGLDIVLGDGLTATVTPGHAFGETILELPKATSITLWDNAINLVWLKNDGMLQVECESLDQPEGGAVYLGCINVQDGAQTRRESYGRFDLRAGNVVRETLDEGMPGDSPSVEPSWFYTVTQGGVWLWTGSRYSKVGD